MNATAIAGAAVLAVMALAGCTGGFTVNQTEPIRVQLEGAPETVVVHESDAEPQRVVIETCGNQAQAACDEVDEVDVEVQVKQIEAGACRIKVTIQDESGNVLEEREVDVMEGDDSDDGMTTSDDGNTTDANATATADGGSTGQVVIQNIVVNVKGKDNIVVLTQALEGSAQVQVNAIKASGNADVDQDVDNGGSTATATATATTTASMTNTTTGP